MGFYDLTAVDMANRTIEMSQYKGKLLLVVNTASKCGFTPQFKGLEELYNKYKDQGVEVIGFPCNQFKAQDPGTNEEIESFCKLNYGVTFQMFQKIDVNGENRHPLYKYLIENSPSRKGEKIKWNFEKFLLDREGNIINRYNSIKTPKSIGKDIKKIV